MQKIQKCEKEIQTGEYLIKKKMSLILHCNSKENRKNENNSTFTDIFLTSCKNSHNQFYMSYVLLITDGLELSTQEFDIDTPVINKIVHNTHIETVISSLFVEHLFSWLLLWSQPTKYQMLINQSEKNDKKLYG